MSQTEFKEVALEIVKEAINSGIYIDDKVLMPFEIDDELENPSELFESFKSRNCSLDIYRYSEDNWSEDLNYVLNNRDLIILDWQLEDDSPNYLPALQILENAVNSKNLHFICIYTKIPNPQLLNDVVYPILSYFCNTGESKFQVSEFKEYLEEQGIDSDEAVATMADYLKELAIYKDEREKRGKIKRELIEFINNIFDEGLNEFRSYIEGIFTNFEDGILELGYYLNDTLYEQESAKEYKINLSANDSEQTIFIDQTLIKIRAKGEITKEELYDNFTDSLLTDHNIFLTLLGLEMRNLFRRSSAFIGKELEGIDELAFFHHHNQYAKEDTIEAFYEFLREIWRDQASSFFLEEDPKLLEALEKYKDEKNIDKNLEEFDKKDDAIKHLSTLNLIYNKLNVIRKPDDIIRFGDIFYSNLEDEKKYFLCLTPQCDCLRAETKIKYHYFFTEGHEVGLKSGLERAETDYISFIKNNDEELNCVDWEECKPFTLYIPDNHIDSDIEINYKDGKIKLRHLCSIKENYAQRIANNAFSYPMRVGIVMANIRSEDG